MEAKPDAATSSARTRLRPPVEAVDLDPANRPGVPRERSPQRWPNARFPPQRMTAPSAVPKHGRPNKSMPPVYGTAVPLRGVSGAIRRVAYRYPDHFVSHWLLLLLGDRVDAWETRTRRVLPFAVPAIGLALVARRLLASRA